MISPEDIKKALIEDGVYEKVLRSLRCLAEGDEPIALLDGICSNLDDLTGREPDLTANILGQDIVATFSKGWKHHSGEGWYPVPHRDYPGAPMDALGEADNIWDPKTEYGYLRRDLCGYVAEKLEEI